MKTQNNSHSSLPDPISIDRYRDSLTLCLLCKPRLSGCMHYQISRNVSVKLLPLQREGVCMHGTLPRGVLASKPSRPKSRAQKIEPQQIVFRHIAILAFPHKTTAALGHLTGCARSTVQTWLSGEHQPPANVLALVLAEVMRRLALRP